MRDVKLLQNTMNWIEAHPEQHNQQTWNSDCGTQYCFAGHAAILAGATPPKPGIQWMINTETLASLDGDDEYDGGVCVRHVADFARQKLGLSYEESEILFHAESSVRELRLLVDAFVTGAKIDENYHIWVDGADLGDVEEWVDLELTND